MKKIPAKQMSKLDKIIKECTKKSLEVKMSREDYEFERYIEATFENN